MNAQIILMIQGKQCYTLLGIHNALSMHVHCMCSFHVSMIFLKIRKSYTLFILPTSHDVYICELVFIHLYFINLYHILLSLGLQYSSLAYSSM